MYVYFPIYKTEWGWTEFSDDGPQLFSRESLEWAWSKWEKEIAPNKVKHYFDEMYKKKVFLPAFWETRWTSSDDEIFEAYQKYLYNKEIEILTASTDAEAIQYRKDKELPLFTDSNGGYSQWDTYSNNIMLILLQNYDENVAAINSFVEIMMDQWYMAHEQNIPHQYKSSIEDIFNRKLQERHAKIQQEFRILIKLTDEEKQTTTYELYQDKSKKLDEMRTLRRKVEYLERAHEQSGNMRTGSRTVQKPLYDQIEKDLKKSKKELEKCQKSLHTAQGKYGAARRNAGGGFVELNNHAQWQCLMRLADLIDQL
jgi:hypothetical protein